MGILKIGIMKSCLEIFDKHFVHLFISAMHVFFIGLGAWLERYDLVVLGAAVFPLSFGAFEAVARYGSTVCREIVEEEQDGYGKNDI